MYQPGRMNVADPLSRAPHILAEHELAVMLFTASSIGDSATHPEASASFTAFAH
jgi:hypothetical protein